MAFSTSPSSSSSLPFTSKWSYDVFLSFRGIDTRDTFIAHLYPALNHKGIRTYKDDKDLERGETISPTLLKTIEESMISIIVLSRNYASSSWCLEELTKILECKETKQQIVLPVFYHIDPSKVRKLEGSFEEALANHQERFKEDPKVQRWKKALQEVASLAGEHLKDGYSGSYVEMHDLLQEMGKEQFLQEMGKGIVRQESPKEAGKCCRLWFHEDVLHVLEENTNLTGMELSNCKFLTKIPDLSSIPNLEELDLACCKNLVEVHPPVGILEKLGSFSVMGCCKLRIHNSLVKKLGGPKFENLTYMDLRDCEFLTKIPDFSSSPNLEELDLACCKNLVEVHHSVGLLYKLRSFSVMGCCKLRILPKRFKLRSLHTFDFRDCSSLEDFPEIECEMEFLQELDLLHTSIKELPSSMENLKGLEKIRMRDCSIIELPSSIVNLPWLKKLYVEGCIDQLGSVRIVKVDGYSKPINIGKVVEEDGIQSTSSIVSTGE